MKILIAAGGTGGHINPAISVADAVRKRCPESRILFVCSGRDIEERIYGRKGFNFRKISAAGIKSGIAAKLVFAYKFILSFFESLLIIAGFRPDIVLGMGGYVSAPVVIAARMFRIPTALHEQNSIPGKANRLTARFASVVMTGFETAAGCFKGKKTVFTGNPVREGMLKADPDAARERFGFKKEVFTVLVVGGSQGAQALNKAAVGAMGILKDKGISIQVIHMAGKARDEVNAEYLKKGITAHCETYFDDIGLAYVISDIVISRCGAIAIAEIAAFAKPSILIPFPFSADGHQKANAGYLADKGAAVVIDEKDLTDRSLADEIFKFYNDGERRKAFGTQSGRLAVRGVEEKILNVLDNLNAR